MNIQIANCEKYRTSQVTGAIGVRPAFLAERVARCRYFCFDLNPPPRTALTITCGGWEQCSASYVVRRDSFRYFALEYVAEGHGYFTCDGRTTELKPGVLFGYAPESAHLIRTSTDHPLVKYFLDFAGSHARSVFSSLPLNEGCSAWICQPHVIRDLFQQIVDAAQEPQGLSNKLCSSLFDLLLLRIEQNAMRPDEIRSRAFETYTQASRILNAGYRSLQSTADVARKLRITPAYLARLFQHYSNTTPHRMLTSLKMAEAASLLVETGASVTHAAAHVGFSDPYHFSRVFKSHYGSAPAHFRAHPRSSEGHRPVDTAIASPD